ncbi:MAG: hypothetical protein V1837_05655 [Candidatus Woesearchaeota archaeon]
MAKKTEKKMETIDDYMNGVRDLHPKDLDEALKHYDKMTSSNVIEPMKTLVFKPAQEELYHKLEEELDKTFKGENESVHNKEKELRQAGIKALEAYFDKVMPGVSKSAQDIADEEKRFHYLARHYDQHVGVKSGEKGSIFGLLSAASDKGGKVRDVKQYAYTVAPNHIEGAGEMLKAKATNFYLGSFHPTDLAPSVKDDLEERGIGVDDKTLYVQHEIPTLLEIRKGARKGKWAKKLEEYGLKYEEKEKNKNED